LPAISRRTFDRNTYIVHHGEGTGSLHLITDGRVEVENEQRRIEVGPGGAFGGDLNNRELSVRALTRVKVLVVEAREIASLAKGFPKLNKRIVHLNRVPRRNKRVATFPRGGYAM
jgi:CRP-like cAMP-binding protein